MSSIECHYQSQGTRIQDPVQLTSNSHATAAGCMYRGSLLRTYGSYSQPVDSWIEALDVKELKPALSALFQKYVEATMDYCRRSFQMVVQQSMTTQALTICKILEGLLPKVPAHRTLVSATVAMPQGSRRQSRCNHYAFKLTGTHSRPSAP